MNQVDSNAINKPLPYPMAKAYNWKDLRRARAVLVYRMQVATFACVTLTRESI